jgi:hypothetical protein
MTRKNRDLSRANQFSATPTRPNHFFPAAFFAGVLAAL